MSHHTAEVGDGGVLVGVGVEQHLRVGVDGYVRLDVLPVLAQELGDGLDLRLRLWVGAAVGVVARVGGGAFLWRGPRGGSVEAGGNMLSREKILVASLMYFIS